MQISPNHYSKQIQYYGFVLAVILSLIFLDIRVTTVLTVITAYLLPAVLYPLLIIIPAIKNVAILSQGFTMTKVLGLLYIFFLLPQKRHSPKIGDIMRSWHFRWVCFYILLIVFNIINFRLFSWTEISAIFSIQFIDIVKNNMFNIAKIAFSLFLFYDFAQMKPDVLKKILHDSATMISLAIIPIFLFTVTAGLESWKTWHVVRSTFVNTKPGEFSYLLSILVPFILYCFIHNQNKIVKIISIISLSGIIYLISITISRGGFLTLIFSLVISLIFLQMDYRKILFSGIIIVTGIAVMVLTSVIKVDDWIVRNRIMNIDLSTLTTYRYDLWVAGLKYSFSEFGKFIFGGGSSPLVDRYIDMMNRGKRNVLHSIYIGNLVKYGFIGLVTFCSIMAGIIFKFFKLKGGWIRNHYPVFAVPFLSLLIALFAGLFVSWEFREILWIFTGIAGGIAYNMAYDRTGTNPKINGNSKKF